MEIPMSSGQFSLGGMDGVDGLQAIHPSQLSIGNNGNERLLNTVSQSMDLMQSMLLEFDLLEKNTKR